MRYDAAAALSGNTIHTSAIGVRTTVAGTVDGLGFVAGSAANRIEGNATGIQSVGAQFQRQQVAHNTVGVTGSGIIGGTSLELANRIADNTTGVAAFSGTIQYSTIAGNDVGIEVTAAMNGLKVWHDVIHDNSVAGMRITGASDIRIYQNTFYAPLGDNIRLQGASSNVEIQGNILWAESGYDIYVANDSQRGFYSDYNNLYQSGSGKLVYWTKDFFDVLDWQADVARYDLHSIGATVVNPDWARPQFLDRYRDDFRLFAVVAGQRFSSPGVDASNVLLDQATPPHYINLIATPGFESGLDGWTVNAGAAIKTSAPAAYQGSQYFNAGSVEQGFAQQSINLLGVGYSVAEIDGGLLDFAFGGRVRSATEDPRDAGAVSLIFLDAIGQEIRRQAVDALNTDARWELVGDRVTAPVGARIAVLRFDADRNAGGTADAWFDQAFVVRVSDAYIPDQGAWGAGTHEAAADPMPRIELVFPDLYTDWEKDEPLAIRWVTTNNIANLPVRIDLLQDSADGPRLLANIATATEDDGTFIWIPASSGIDFGTKGLRIQVSLAQRPWVLDRAQETFSVPEDGQDYYVDDQSDTGDAFTPGAIGSNRNTGKTALTPKPNPVNVVRAYDLQAGDTLSIDTGDYPMIDPIGVSGSNDISLLMGPGMGRDEGFTITGPSDTDLVARLFPAIPGDRTRALIDLDDADFVTIRHLTLDNAQRGVYVHDGSDSFEASFLTASGHASEGFYIETAAPFGDFDHLVARNNGASGVVIKGSIASLTHAQSLNNAGDGFNISARVGSISDSIARDNSDWGFELYQPGDVAMLRNESSANRAGIQVSNGVGGTTARIGDTDLAAGNGNLVFNNRDGGIYASYGALVAGNTVSGHLGSNAWGIYGYSNVSVDSNVVYGNTHGIYDWFGRVDRNRVYANLQDGVRAENTDLLGNVVYANAVGLRFSEYYNQPRSARNNLVYGNTTAGVVIGGTAQSFINNTVYQTTGDAVRVNNASNTQIYNNILRAGAGYALSVASDSQVGFASDFNLFLEGGTLGQWQGVDRNTLAAWRGASFTDANSLVADPLFVDADGADNQLGYLSLAQDGRDDDFHVRSAYGGFQGGSGLAPVRDASSGLPVLLAPAALTSTGQSPAIDRGRASDPYANEPTPNGGYINIGVYGNTAQAGRSPEQYITVLNPNGGERIGQDSTVEIRWRSFGFTGNVDIAYRGASAADFTTLAAGEANDGSWGWLVDSAVFAAGTDYQIRITSVDAPAVTDLSDANFSVIAPITFYYVNDGSLAGDEYTTALGSDANDGLSPDQPKASIRGILDAYDLKPGDVVLVDTGHYTLGTNIFVQADDSGATIQGALAHQTILDRGNTNTGAYVFELRGADDVTLANLSLTCAQIGVYADNAIDSDRVSLVDSRVWGDANYAVLAEAGNDGWVVSGNLIEYHNYGGVYLRGADVLVEGNEIARNNGNGVNVSGARARVLDNVVYANYTGMVASFNGARADGVVLAGNRVFDSYYDGIQASYTVEVRDNEVWGNGATGVAINYGARAHDNVVWGNATGLSGYSNGVIYDNRVWANQTGIGLTYSSQAYGNRVYGNTGAGINVTGYDNWVRNNLVYANGGAGVLTNGVYFSSTGTRIENNTIVGTQADALVVQGNSSDVRIRNNILQQSGSGYALNVASNSQQGFSSDYNLFMLGSSAKLGYWEDRAFLDRTDWFYELGQDRNSVSTDARFVDADGADDVLGWDASVVGGSVRIVDDGDATYAGTGNWTAVALPAARGGDMQTAVVGDGSSQASWTFNGLAPGYYRVAATWPYQANYNNDALFRVYDGDAVVGAARVNQNYSAASGFTDAGSNWANLAVVRIDGASLKVVLDNLANGKVMADALRIERLVGDFGADDDMHLRADSPAIDRGDPRQADLGELAPNGNRVDLGAYGNTSQANASADPMVQILGPNGLEKVEVGAPVTVSWRSAGLLAYDSVLRLDAGQTNAAAAPGWQAQVTGDRTDGYEYYYGSIGAGTALNMSALPAGTPEAMVRSYAYVPGGEGYQVSYQLGAADGAYQAVLYFVEPSNIPVGARKFDIVANGTVLASDVDIRALAGGYNKAVALTLDVNVSGGQGLKLEFVNKTASYGALVGGIELRRANANGVANPVLSLQASIDDGANWTTVATGLTLDAYGNGQTQWTPDTETVGNTARLRVVATINPASGTITVSDVSDEGFLIANAGNAYYVNDGSLAGDEYTTAVGNNANSGKDPSRPMASLAALLRAYDLDAGDVVYVDSGTYSLATNIVLDAQDSGATIQGAQQPGHASVLDRGNTNAGAYVFELRGADDVTLANLSITGAYHGVRGVDGADSDRVTLRDSKVFGNAYHGVSVEAGSDDFTLRGSAVHNNGNSGVYLYNVRALVEGNELYGNAYWGANVYSGGAGNTVTITGNKVHDNASGGLTAGGYVLLTGNDVYSHLGSGDKGIQVSNNAVARDNRVHHNYDGIYAYSSGTADHNEVYFNSRYGIDLWSNGKARNNRIYSNSVGINQQYYSTVENNLVYVNTNVGIQIGSYADAQFTRNNTIYQPVGDAVLVQASAINVRLDNNIIQVNAGYGINLASAGSLVRSDYNLFWTPQSGARVGLLAGVQQTSLTDWRSASSKDAHSKLGDPLFLDIDGADNILGERNLVAGNGFDDNFGLRAHSVAIDAANMYVAPPLDIDGQARRDDPSTANTGDGLPKYVATAEAFASFPVTGTKLNMRNSDYATGYTLPFAFPFYGQSYTTAYINTNGFLQFGSGTGAYGGNDANSLQELVNYVRIAPLWDNLSTYLASDATRDIYADASVADQVTIRWAAVVEGSSNPVNFSVTLFKDGRFRFDYGPSASGLTPTVGVSAGNGQTYALAPYDGLSDLSTAGPLLWAATAGLDYYDIGAYEFLGDSSDATPPTVTAISQLPAEGGSTAGAFSSLQIDFSEPLDRISARSPANYELLFAGDDGVFGSVDDSHIAIEPGYSFPETNLTLQFTAGVLAEGHYRLRLSGTLGIFDTAGNLLDGDGNGVAGADYVRTFTIDRSGNLPPSATDAVASTNEGESVLITLAGTDPNDDALTFSLVTDPAHGQLSEFDPVAHTVRYTPDASFNGTDSFRFRVDDGNLGTDDGNLIVTVLPVNTRPAGADLAVATDEDTAVQLLLPGSDVETAHANLVFEAASQPAHGSLILGPGGLWTYTPDADYHGSDSFTYTVTDRGDPDGATGNALTSLPSTVTLTVRAVNDAPRIDAITAPTVHEGQTLQFQLPASDPDGDALSYSLVGAAIPGASIDAGTGILTYVAADGPLSVPFTVRVSDGVLSTDVSFDVSVLNVAPTIALGGAASVDAGTPWVIAFSAADPGQDTIASWRVNWGDGSTQTLAGSATGATHVFSIGGNFSVTVTVTDEDGNYTSAPLAVRSIAPNRAPVVPAQNGTVDEDQSVLLTLSYGDPDGDPLTVSFPSGPAHGVLSDFNPATRQLRYTPNADYNGTDSFELRADDGLGGVTTATVSLTVRAVNDAPQAVAATVAVTSGQTLTGQLAGTDLETAAGALVFALVDGPAHGSLSLLADGSFSYTPSGAYVGTDTFRFQVTDSGDPAGSGSGLGAPLSSAPQTVTIDVLQPNRAPLAQDDGYSAHAGQPLLVAAPGLLGNDSDPDGDTLHLVGVNTDDLHGVLVTSGDGGFSFTPDAGFLGQTSFMYTVGDGAGATDSAVVTITVGNQAPQFAPIADAGVRAGETVALTLSATDPDGVDVLTYSLVGGPAGALLDGATGALSWSAPYLDAAAVYGFTVRVSDGLGGSDQQSFDVTVDPDLLQVSSIQWTDTGYRVRFNHAFDVSTLNLYDGQGMNRGAADAVLRDAANKPVAGSIVTDADAMGFSFVKTGSPAGDGLLVAGNYTLELQSRADAFVDAHGRWLDGNADGTAGGAYSAQTTVAASSAAFVSVGEFTRGAGQDVNLPASGAGIPVRIGNAAGASTVGFTLHYDPTLLTIGGALSNLAGVTVSTDLSVAGQVGVQVSGISGLTNATVELVHLVASVPTGALAHYASSQLLDLRDVSVNGGALPVRDDDGVHVAAYLSDATGDRVYGAGDAQAVLDVISRKYSGFGAYPLTDPVVVAGAWGNGKLGVFDVRLIGNVINGVPQTYIPPLPVAPALGEAGPLASGTPQPAQAEPQPAAPAPAPAAQAGAAPVSAPASSAAAASAPVAASSASPAAPAQASGPQAASSPVLGNAAVAPAPQPPQPAPALAAAPQAEPSSFQAAAAAAPEA
ncbi:MAG: tandem-95 repeat protein, partial [Chloroflexi bacterium]|nr:tandem-95 repeat protein [Chloroflexota bacterium]